MATPEAHAGPRPISRRDVLVVGAGAVIGAGVVGTGIGVGMRVSGDGAAAETTEEPGPELRRFVSTTLTAPVVTTWTRDGAAPSAGLLFASPRTISNNGLILQSDGEPVWIEPDGRNVMDVRVQQYRGRPVLTYWEGTIVDGWGIGVGTIKDSSYRTIATVRAGNGMTVDLHEFILTSRGTALLIAYPVETRDLSPIGGPREGFVLGGRIQEIDVATGEVLFDWDVLDHVELGESYQELGESGATAETAFDPVHLNSIAEDGDALLLSARHTHALYWVDRVTGEIRWRLGGQKSDFEVEDDAAFLFQHDARRQADGTISLYDNHGQVGTEGAVSAGLLLDLDEEARTATLHRRFAHRERFGGAMGNMHVLGNGNVLVGWGTDPTATEFTVDGTAIYEARGLGDACYRVYRSEWTAQPASIPDVGVRTMGGGEMRVYSSWNGATGVASWRILTGPDAGALIEAATVARSGFETVAPVPAAGAVMVEALDSSGAVLAVSAPRAT